MPPMTNKLPTSFRWLNATQALGALNDNLFKLLLIFLLVTIQGEERRTVIVTAASGMFVLPFLLFSSAAGVLADHVSKSRIILVMKFVEVLTMTLGCTAVYFRSPPAMYAVLFLLCTHSAVFGPAKYGVIPELVPEEQLSRANSLLVGLTYLAIIVGMFLPSFVLDYLHLPFLGLGSICLVIAAAGAAAALRIERTPPAGSTQRFSPLFVLEVYRTLRGIRHDRYLLLSVVASAYFLFLGGFIQQNILLYGHDHLGLTVEKSGYLFSLAALGIGIGALIAGRLSGRNIEFGIVPVGAVGLALTCIGLGVVTPTVAHVCILVFLVGVSSGLFIVPLNAFIQHRSPLLQRGQILAANSFLSFLGVALSSALLFGLNSKLGASPRLCFLVLGLLTGALAVAAGRVLPDFLVRFVAVVITRCVYRIRIQGVENIPVDGAALLVSNHVTWADAVLLSVMTQRRIRFVMSREIMEGNWMRPLFRVMNVIPISAQDPPRRIVQSLQAARAALDDGYLVCIFAEGALTRNGNLRAFRGGLERILKGSRHPILPICIGGAWGSIFSYYHGRLLAHRPKSLPYPIWIAVGPALAPDSTSGQVRQAILELSGTTFDMRKHPSRNLACACVRTARKYWRLLALSDTTGKRLTFGRTLAGAIALARELEPHVAGQDHVGLLLPASVGGALGNVAVTITGRVPVNLNFTSSRAAVQHAVAQAGLRTIVTSRAFLEKLEGFEPPPGLVYIEDLLARITPGARLRALLLARFAPARRLMTHRQSGPDDLAAIIFSSGSTGLPKGIMLTHHNLVSNVESFGSIFGFEHTDRICAILPLFHSFGFTATLWCPLLLGFAAHYHPNPIDAAGIADAVRTERLTILMATPTFLLGYIRRATREDFATLRFVVTGAEKLKTRVADAFEERFGIRPQEGYGTTELSPVVSVNLKDVSAGEVEQVGTKEGSVGHPIPGVAVRVVDPATGRLLGANETGMLLVRGPNVMRGYLGEPERTAAVLQDGWYSTGDIARVDEDGFVFILDRLSRFSKIGGEMVPHLAVEERLMDASGAAKQAVAVTSTPDERKGEQLVVLYTPEAGDPARLQRALRESDLPNLWKPRDDCYVRVDALPMLGSGKLDIMRVKEIAKSHLAPPPPDLERA